jgi:hypothetical protein
MAQDYQARLRIPVDGDPAMRLFTRSGTLVADVGAAPNTPAKAVNGMAA